jgi:hypothetical protein
MLLGAGANQIVPTVTNLTAIWHNLVRQIFYVFILEAAKPLESIVHFDIGMVGIA